MSEIKSAIHISVGGGSDISLTTTGTSGAATLVDGTLNIPNYSSGGGGGTSTKFGKAGEDAAAAENRYMDMQGHSFTVDLANIIELWATDADFNFHSHIVGDNNNLRCETENSLGQAQSLMDATASQILVDTTAKAATGSEMNYSSMSLQPKWKISNPSEEIFSARFLSTLANTVSGQGSDLRLPYLSGGIHWIAAVRVEDDFADDSAAATGGVKVGQYYHTSGVVKIRLS